MTTYISFSSDISPHSSEVLIAAMAEQANKGIKEVCLMISTPGGSVIVVKSAPSRTPNPLHLEHPIR